MELSGESQDVEPVENDRGFIRSTYSLLAGGGPGFLARTPAAVVEEKEANRAECERLVGEGQFAEAVDMIHQNVAGKKMAAEYGAKIRSHASMVVPLVLNKVLFSMGVMASVVPFLPLMGAAMLLRVRIPLVDWSVIMPVVNAMTVYGVCVFLVFQFVVEVLRINQCLLVSGHWYTYTLTTVAFTLVLIHFYVHRQKTGGAALVAYVAYAVGYQSLVLPVLANTQRFYHDTREACAGVGVAIVLAPFLMAVVVLVDMFMEERKRGDFAAEAHDLFTEVRKLDEEIAGQTGKKPVVKPP
eukprot:CAMPEP_0119132612 /NCGR_PEP_ID=MMETSP1310-20130426/11927_1 /TAXON_ID=464262 /ORGANISM="Genus nov. species nov., Strain RCC2339" /LENGTH=297 /DNA_ID=CAMNT_0007123251 /DNA_START=261 /DNA_END=1151 /DNA_ORIENTATION=+